MMTLLATKETMLGTWISIAPEVRPSASKNADGTLKPFYLTRTFTYLPNDEFELEIINTADANGKLPLVKINLKGHIIWEGEYPIADGAQKVHFIANASYEVTPLLPAFADVMNQVAKEDFTNWEINITQSILGKTFVPFGLAKGQIFGEYDLIYVLSDMLFWGARNIDGRGFETPENRPTNLQIPLIKKR